MTQQGNLFAPKPRPSGEGKWCVAVKFTDRWWNTSRDHLFPTPAAAHTWLEKQRLLHFGIPGVQVEVKLLEEINNE